VFAFVLLRNHDSMARRLEYCGPTLRRDPIAVS